MSSSTEARERLRSGLVGDGDGTGVQTGAVTSLVAGACSSFALSLCLLSSSLI